MKILNEDTHLDTFFDKLRYSSNRALLLDYDGTLAPFRAERDEATPYPGVRELLNALIDIKQLRVILISGRAIDDLTPLLRLKRLPEIWGSHGWERLLPDGRHLAPDLTEPARRLLAQVPDWIQAEGLQSRYEPKPAGFALHWRGTNESIAREIREKTLQKCGRGPDRSGPHSFLSYRNRLRRHLAPILILAIGGTAMVVGRGSRLIAGTVLGEETRSKAYMRYLNEIENRLKAEKEEHG